MTPLSSSTAYCTASELLARYDTRLLGDLAGDAGTRLPASQLETDPNVGAALEDASGEIESAALRGGRYTPADLNALTGMAAARLMRLTCRVAVMLLMERRDPSKAWPEWVKNVREDLQRLAMGERIFGFVEVAGAGTGPESVAAPDALRGPRPALSDTARRFFGFRARTYPVWK